MWQFSYELLDDTGSGASNTMIPVKGYSAVLPVHALLRILVNVCHLH